MIEYNECSVLVTWGDKLSTACFGVVAWPLSDEQPRAGCQEFKPYSGVELVELTYNNSNPIWLWLDFWGNEYNQCTKLSNGEK